MKLFNNYQMDKKPLVKAVASQKAFKQKDENLAPLTRPVASNSAFGENIMAKNKVTEGSSSRLQKAAKVPGRAKLGASHIEFS